MPGSRKSEDRAAVKKVKKEAKKDAKKKEAAVKTPVIETVVTLANSGAVTKATTFNRKDVEKNSKSKPAKSLKKIGVKVFLEKAEFTHSIIPGDRKKKRLPYACIRLMEQLSSDGRMVFIHYEKSQNGRFLVLGFNKVSHVTDFINAAKESNSSMEVRLPVEESPEEKNRNDTEATSNDYESVLRVGNSQNAYNEPKSSKRPSKGMPVQSTYVYTARDDDDDDDGKTSSSMSFKHKQQKNTINNNSQQRVQQPSYHYQDRSYTPLTKPDRHDTLVTKYLYIGPSDEEDSENESKRKDHHKKHKSQKPRGRSSSSHNYYQYNNISDEISLSATDETLDVDAENFYDYEAGRKPAPSQNSSNSNRKHVSRHSKPRSKSRELPLSEAETRRGGWHSDIMFLTPTKDGGAKVSADGPVMLYTATRSNVRYSDDEDDDDESSDDGGFSEMDDSFSTSSGSTLTLEEIGLNGGMMPKKGVDYNRGGFR